MTKPQTKPLPIACVLAILWALLLSLLLSVPGCLSPGSASPELDTESTSVNVAATGGGDATASTKNGSTTKPSNPS